MLSAPIHFQCLVAVIATPSSLDASAAAASASPNAASSTRPGVTVRLDAEAHARLQQIAKAEHRSVAAVLERLVEREIHARDEAERVIRVHVAPDVQGQPFGEPDRRPGESDKSYARRKKTIDALFGR
jgi:predicted transcriptional regulator